MHPSFSCSRVYFPLIQRADIIRITDPSACLNDNGLNAYFWLLADRSMSQSRLPKVWCAERAYYFGKHAFVL